METILMTTGGETLGQENENSKKLAIATTSHLVPSDHEMMVYNVMAEQAVSSKMYRGIGDKAGVMMIMLAARELQIPPMQALNGGINIINGKVEISARMMSALIRKAGHIIKIKESTDEHCILIGKRCDTGETEESHRFPIKIQCSSVLSLIFMIWPALRIKALIMRADISTLPLMILIPPLSACIGGICNSRAASIIIMTPALSPMPRYILLETACSAITL